MLQVHNHFPDFETDPAMMEYLEKFETVLEKENMNGQLRMLLFACAEKVGIYETVSGKSEKSVGIPVLVEITIIPFLGLWSLLFFQARKRTITLTRAARSEALQFELMGGHERGFGIFVERVRSDLFKPINMQWLTMKDIWRNQNWKQLPYFFAVLMLGWQKLESGKGWAKAGRSNSRSKQKRFWKRDEIAKCHNYIDGEYGFRNGC